MTAIAGKLLKERRVQSGIGTQQDAAEKFGVDRDTWGRYETGKLPCPVDILHQAEDVFGAPGLFIQYLRAMDEVYHDLPAISEMSLPSAQLFAHSELGDICEMRRAADKALADGKIAPDEEPIMLQYASQIDEAVNALVTLRANILRCLIQKKSPLQRQRAEVI